MADIVSRAVRSRMMAGIRSKNTRPEILIRYELFARGYRYRLHVSTLPGKPDLVFPKLRAVIFVHGCFWHRHACPLFKWPSTNVTFWRTKILGNCAVDRRVLKQLKIADWRVLTIWECSLKGAKRAEIDRVVKAATQWLDSHSRVAEIQRRRGNRK
ncbi:MAG: very short patch repair endonuclease [Candidatus Binatus sp.]|uniref:very short patch repair endonuclease n=1 Tax=Candidatus Binatus sp. TaxID=2811406 RepID=UPI003C71978A